jgi:hypothetical protein
VKVGARVLWGMFEGTIMKTGINERGAWCGVDFDCDAFGDAPHALFITFWGRDLESLVVLEYPR